MHILQVPHLAFSMQVGSMSMEAVTLCMQTDCRLRLPIAVVADLFSKSMD